MIRINLLGVTRQKRAKGPSFSVGAGANTMVIVLILAALTLGGNYYYYWKIDSTGKELQAQLQAAKNENARLAATKARYTEREKVFQLYDRRVKVIHQLQDAQNGPSDLLNTVAATVSTTDAVWLNSMTEDGANINLSGNAISANAVANLITNLKKTNYFKTVEIKETYQDDTVKDVQAFAFKIVCEKTNKA